MDPHRGYRDSKVPENAVRVFEGKIFDVYQWDQVLYDGSTAVFEKIVRPDTAMVIPVLPDGSILLIEDSQPHRAPVITAPTGKVEPGETPAEAARRELLEETGYSVESLEPLSERTITEKMDWIVYSFVGRGAKKAAEPNPEAGEKIVPRIVSFEEFFRIASEKGYLRFDTAEMALEAATDPAKMAAFRKRILG
jgi:ADP-ribose pyrophosphatase YjhB (NUDIX family)